tara:strand:+ start:31 stop:723 length:693 start_codon:yes stop_codon:yes gene_type:complete
MFGFLLCLLGCQIYYSSDADRTTVQVHNVTSYNKGIDNSVKSSVKIGCYKDGVFTSKGSGNYLKKGRDTFVLTAAHVVAHCDEIHIVNRYGSSVLGEVTYQSDSHRDIAIVKPKNKLTEVEPVLYIVDKNKTVGERVYFMGHPDELDFFLFEGMVSVDGMDGVFLHSTAWGGVSGSVVFNKQGKIVGVAKAVKVTVNPITGLPRLLEDLVLVSKVDFLSKETLRESIDDR